MLVASWNVNSIRARQERVIEWIDRTQPDILCLQETKVPDDAFPAAKFESRGYHVVVHGQKAYNGVAILARARLEQIRRGFEDQHDEVGARLLGATAGGVHIFSCYVPNGKVVGSADAQEKLRWLTRLRALVDNRFTARDRVLLCGDFNVAAEERDVHDPVFWRTQVLFHPTMRNALQDLCTTGLVDTFRIHHQEGGLYSWWDYRLLGFPKNRGLRIDYVFATPALAAHCTAATIDREARKGKDPSDHAPVLARFDL